MKQIKKVEGDRHAIIVCDPLDTRDYIEVKMPDVYSMQVPIDKKMATLMVVALSEYIASPEVKRTKRAISGKRDPVVVDSVSGAIFEAVDTLMAPNARRLQTLIGKEKRGALLTKDLQRPPIDHKKVLDYVVGTGKTVNINLAKGQEFTLNLARTICTGLGSKFGGLCDKSSRIKSHKIKVVGDSLEECVKKAMTHIRVDVAEHDYYEGVGRSALTKFLKGSEIYFRAISLKGKSLANGEKLTLELTIYFKPVEKKVKNGTSKI